MPNAYGSCRHNLWDEDVKKEDDGRSGAALLLSGARRSTSRKSTPGQSRKSTGGPKDIRRARAKKNWATVRKCVNAMRFWKRMAMHAGQQTEVDLGSLNMFVDKVKLKDVIWTREQEAKELEKQQHKKEAADAMENVKERPGPFQDDDGLLVPKRPQTVPVTKHGGPRRQVFRVGNALSAVRVQSPRNQQLRALIPANEHEMWTLAWMRTEGLPWDSYDHGEVLDAARPAHLEGFDPISMHRMSALMQKEAAPSRPSNSASGPKRPITAPAQASPRIAKNFAEFRRTNQSKKKKGETGFTPAMFSGTAAKPRAEAHPLLTAFEGMQHDEVLPHSALESGMLSQRMDELRWSELRKGTWTSRPEKRGPSEKDAGPAKQQGGHVGERRELEHSGNKLVSAAIAQSAANAGIKDIHGNPDEMMRLMSIMDPESKGVVPPEVFVPLFFWLGLTRRRTAALETLKMAFGPGDIEVTAIQKLSRYCEVQIRLIEGLRQLARRESLEQLCEFITDMMRLRTWFHTMKRDTTGHADIVEVQNLFARMEVTSDRQTLFRFLTHIIHSEVLPSSSPHSGGATSGAIGKRTFGIGDFASLLCRCAVAWCLHRTLMLLENPANNGWKDGDVVMAPADLDRDAEMRWVALQRKIIVSLLVNHRFWGRESRTVLMSLNQPQMTTLGNQLSPEQWLSLFQRVRAQGIASTLPIGDEATDPDFMRNLFKTSSNPR